MEPGEKSLLLIPPRILVWKNIYHKFQGTCDFFSATNVVRDLNKTTEHPKRGSGTEILTKNIFSSANLCSFAPAWDADF